MDALDAALKIIFTHKNEAFARLTFKNSFVHVFAIMNIDGVKGQINRANL